LEKFIEKEAITPQPFKLSLFNLHLPVGHKVHPIAFRLGVNKTWLSRWFSTKKDFASILHRDLTLRRALKERLKDGSVSKIEIERASGSVKVNIFTSKPGIIIGRQGASIEELRQELSLRFGEKIEVNVVEVANPDSDAQLIADNVAQQIEKRVAYRRAVRQSMGKVSEGRGVRGIKIRVGGRLNGAEIAREETFKEGNIPLHTLRSDIDYGFAFAKTTYGTIGVKVWTYKGEIFAKEAKKEEDGSYLAESRKKAATDDKEKGRLEEELAEAS
jgi:small subunit ribosomal protein S3